MSDVWGTIIIPNLDDFSGFDISNIPDDSEPFVTKIFETGGFNIKALSNGAYTIEEILTIDGYIQLTIFGDEWVPFAKSAMREDRHLEFYGALNSEYGTCMYFARNANGESFYYWYEDDGGDESEQDDFDIDQYKKELAEKEIRYLSIIPDVLKASCEDILPRQPLFLLDEE